MPDLTDMPSSIGSDTHQAHKGGRSSSGQAGGSLDAFQSLLDGWNTCQHTAQSQSGSVQCQFEQEPSMDPLVMVSGATQVDEQLRLLTRDTQRISEDIIDAQLRLRELENELEQARVRERATALDLLRTLLNRYQLRAEDLAEFSEPPASGSPNQVDGSRADSCKSNRSRYVGPAGEVWHGRGRYPKWLKQMLEEGRRLSDFEHQPEFDEASV